MGLEDDNDVEAGPKLPPEVDDEEGRFFGGGLTTDTTEVLDFIDEREKGDTWVSDRSAAPRPY